MEAIPSNHIGQKIKRIREIRGFKQDVLALELGLSQQMISNIEDSAEVDEKTLVKISNVLGVSIAAILAYNDEALIHHLKNLDANIKLHDYYFNCTYNPLDKIIELYERLLKSKDDCDNIMEI
jgi:transcriptional regulator with XRE-family HTH domain